jgi:hypothetical protein
MKCYDLYGSRALSLEDLRRNTEAVLGLRFELHESYFMGGDYYLFEDSRGERIVIQRNNLDGDDPDDILEDEFPDYSMLLRVEDTARADDLKELLVAINDLDFLRRKIF